MSRLLVAGVGPIAPEKPGRLFAPGLRVWSFAEHLARNGHEVALVEGLFGGGGEGAQDLHRAADLVLPDGVELWRVPLDWKKGVEACRLLHSERRFDAAVATTDLMCRALAEARLTCPIWLDFFGHPMAERQMLCAVYENDGGLRGQWEMLVPSLLAGDRYSTCSDSQKNALLGELALTGRISEKTAATDLVHSFGPVTPSLDLTPTGAAARGKTVPANAFIVLWTGGYNTWTDVGTLFEGLTRGMEKEPRLYYVSTGGAIEGHDDRTFRRFQGLVEASPLRQRFVFAGWVALDEVKNYYAEAGVAVNIDADTVEARFGTRNRVTEWILAGTPVVSTALSEYARRLAEAGAITSFPAGDAQALCDALLAHDADRQLGRRQNARAREYLERHHTPGAVYRELLAWVADPQPAPDLPPPARRGAGQPLGPDNLLARRLADLHARPSAPRRKRFGFGLGVKPRIEAWLRGIIGRRQ